MANILHRFGLFLWGLLPSMGLAFGVSVLSWWLLAMGPLRESELARGDHLIGDLVFALETDARPEAGPPFVFIDYDSDSWQGSGSPGETPQEIVVQSLRYARSSGARIVLLDIDLAARQAMAAAPHLPEPEIMRALADWEADAGAPLLLLTLSGSGAAAGRSSLERLTGAYRRIAVATTDFSLDGDGVVRAVSGWACRGQDRQPVPSALLYVAAMRAGQAIQDIKSVVGARVREACLSGDESLAFGAEIVRYREPILFHLSGRVPAVAGASQPAFERLSVAEVRTELAEPPQSLNCQRQRPTYAEAHCGGIVVIGGSHEMTTDRYMTPLAAPDDSLPDVEEAASDPRRSGAIILGNAMRGYWVFGPARVLGVAGSLFLLLLSVIAVFLLFSLWQWPWRRVRRWRRSRVRWKSVLGHLDWLFSPVIAKLVATALWTLIIVLALASIFTIVPGPGIIVAFYAAAITFAIREFQTINPRGR